MAQTFPKKDCCRDHAQEGRVWVMVPGRQKMADDLRTYRLKGAAVQLGLDGATERQGAISLVTHDDSY